ncbi:MAG: protein kinase domain-containing protein [Cellvibrionaceae bacterium]
MSNQLRVSIGQYSEKGVKDTNQDSHGARVPKDSLRDIKGIALAMADGISSSQDSHIASETAVKSFLQDYFCTSETWSVQRSMERVLSATNSWLYGQTQRGPGRFDKNKGYVCTISALVLAGRQAHLLHVGDTRIYRVSAKGLEQLTNDHRVWSSESQSHLSRALGIEPQCAFDHQSLRIEQGDVFFIATDGVYEFVDSTLIVEAVAQCSDDLDAACEKVVQLALEAGSDDNLSLQIVRVDQLPVEVSHNIKRDVASKPFPPQLRSRMIFDGYTIIRKLHGSSRSHVYLAKDNETDTKVVLKAPSVDLGGSDDYLERLLMEEWIARRVNSAHVLKSELQSRPRNYLYTTSEYIEGQTLAQWAMDNPKPNIETVRDIVEQIARGLQAFHRLEMLHQDLRPENVIIDTNGTVKIIDFGAVFIAGVEEHKTQSPESYLMGTALYSAPEYFLGQRGSVQSEIFSLGVITYFLLSGNYPYGTDVAKARTLNQQKKLWYRTVLDEEREIPAWVDDAIHKAVHPLPEKRYEQLFEFTHDLRHPNQSFVKRTRPPLLETNPVAVWQGVSFILACIVIYLLAS